MEEAARRYARRVLLLHLVLLMGVLALIVGAARETYRQARNQVLTQAIQRQELLATQTAGATEAYYRSLLSNLQLVQNPDEPGPDETRPAVQQMAQTPPPPLTTVLLWNQLEGRASHLFVYHRNSRTVGLHFPANSRDVALAIASGDVVRQWLSGIEKPSISQFFEFPNGGGNLVAVPMRGDAVAVAVVPTQFIEQRFLDRVNIQDTMSATLLDDTGRTMATSDRSLIGGQIFDQLTDSGLRDLIASYMKAPRLHTEVVETPIEAGGIILPPRMVSAAPISVGDGRNWTLMISSHLSEVDEIVRTSFGRALVWAIFIGVSFTAILVSTAVQMIRSRTRLERARHEALTRELDAARQIQLAWLPTEDIEGPQVDVAAVNEPASHISGDFYDWFELPDGRTVVTIGDVTGHGMAAAFLMATTQLLVRNTMPRVLDPAKCLESVNRQLCTRAFSGQFVTMLVCVIDVEKAQIECATAGHFPPLVADQGGVYQLKVEPQLVLGIDRDTTFVTERFDLPDHSTVLLYTDGVLDAVNRNADYYGIDRLQGAFSHRDEHVQQTLERIAASITEFRDGAPIKDDLTLVAIQLHCQPAPVRSPDTRSVVA